MPGQSAHSAFASAYDLYFKVIMSKKSEKNRNSYWTWPRSACILSALFVLGVSTLKGEEKGSPTIRHDGKTMIRAAAAVKESRVLDKLSLLDNELEEIRKTKLALQDERASLVREKARMRKEFIDTMQRYQLLESMYRRLQLGVAAVVDESGKTTGEAREEQLLEALRRMIDDNKTLTLKVVDFCDYMDGVMDKIQPDKLERARIQYRLDGLRGDAGQSSAATEQYSRKSMVEESRILAVNAKLRVVVIAAGAVQGVKNGLNWFAGKDRTFRLQVVAVRPFIAAATVVEGNINELAPGMQVFTGSGKKQQ